MFTRLQCARPLSVMPFGGDCEQESVPGRSLSKTSESGTLLNVGGKRHCLIELPATQGLSYEALKYEARQQPV